jgi:predicted nucleotide-binding protein
MKSKFEGPEGSRLLQNAVMGQKIVGGHAELAKEMAAGGTLMEVKAATTLIEQGAEEDDLYLILAGSFNVLVNGKHAALCGPGDHVGEMSPMQTMKRRTATVVAAEDSVVLRLSGEHIANLGEKYPPVWRHMAKELARRLDHHNAKVTKFRERSRILLIAPSSAMDVARALEKALQKDACTVDVWTDGVFRSAKYPIGRLEEELDESDFAVAIAGPVESGGDRENIIFELGFLIGRLGRNRTVLLEPATDTAELPSDLTGLTAVGYRAGTKADLAAAVAPAADRIRTMVGELGPNR